MKSDLQEFYSALLRVSFAFTQLQMLDCGIIWNPVQTWKGSQKGFSLTRIVKNRLEIPMSRNVINICNNIERTECLLGIQGGNRFNC